LVKNKETEMVKTHNLKTINCFYVEIINGNKTFEIRKNDRDFKEGDLLVLQEVDDGHNHTGRESKFRVTYILNSAQFEGIREGYVVMAIQGIPSLSTLIKALEPLE